MTIQNNFPAIKPSLNLDFANTKQLDPRITFARASTARYYDGKTTAKAEENLLTFSEQFDNGVWTKASATVTANATTAPDGTTTADQVTITGSGLFLQQVAVVPGTTYTVSFYALAGTATTVNYLIFNVTASSTIVAPTNYVPLLNSSTWTRVSFSFTVPAGCTSIYVDLARASSNGTVNLWGAQLEQRSSVTAYTPTTTAPITNYIPVLQTAAAGTPRFDHNPVTGESLGLLIEEQRTNLLPYSEDFSNAAWTKGNVTITTNTSIAPDGTLTADKLVEDATANANKGISVSVTSTTNTFSIYAKAAERSWFYLRAFGNNVFFNLATGVIGANSGSLQASIVSVGNGWYRCSVVVSPNTSAAYGVFVTTADNTTNYTGNGYSGIYIWGAQLEAGAFATSYIPTVASQVTRAADSASITGANFSSWYRQDEGAIYCESFIPLAADSDQGNYYFAISDGTINNTILAADVNGTVFQVIANGIQFNQAVGTEPSTFARIALAYKTNDFIGCVNSVLSSADTVGTPPTVDRLTIGARGDSSANAINGGTIKRIAYYPRRISNTQLQALTS